MGIEHEAIHLETSAVLIRQLPLEVLIPYPESSVFNNDFRVTPTKPEDVSPFGFITVPESEVTLGRPFSLENADSENKSNYVPIYGWDNEFGKHSFTLKEFHLADRLVSNADFLHFVNDKCYEAEQFWSTEGWKWV
jgi:formylglycine-generating enzyme required for sulfatase activity